MIPKPSLTVSKYEGLVTVFALMMAVEYASGSYDLWDLFVGLLSIYLGSLYWQSAKEKSDFLYSLLTSCLISLGIVTVIFGSFFVVATGVFGLEQKPSIMKVFWIENARFVLFGFVTYLLNRMLKSRNTHNKSIQPTADASAD